MKEKMIAFWNYMNFLGMEEKNFNSLILAKKKELELDDQRFSSLVSAWACTLSIEFPPLLKKYF